MSLCEVNLTCSVKLAVRLKKSNRKCQSESYRLRCKWPKINEHLKLYFAFSFLMIL